MGYIESTNPCFSGDVRLATDRGLLTFGELCGEKSSIAVLTDNRAPALREAESAEGTGVAVRLKTGVTLREAVPVFKTRRDWPVFRLETMHGFEVVATDDHKFFTPNGLKELGELKEGDEILIQSGQGVWSHDESPSFLLPGKQVEGPNRGREGTTPEDMVQGAGRVTWMGYWRRMGEP